MSTIYFCSDYCWDVMLVRRTLTKCPCCRPGTASHDHLWSAVVPQFAVGAGHAASPLDLRRGCALRLHQVLRQPTATPACQVRHQCLRPRVGKAGKCRSDVRTLDLSTHTLCRVKKRLSKGGFDQSHFVESAALCLHHCNESRVVEIWNLIICVW